MISLFAALAGFLGSLMPYLLSMFRDVSDKNHELKILDKQIEMQKMGIKEHLEEIKIISDSIELKELYSTYKTNVKWVDAFNGSVRPILAYSFFLLYVYVKYLQASFILNSAPVFKYIEILWTVEDQAIFAGIISFYFGQRTISKFKNR